MEVFSIDIYDLKELEEDRERTYCTMRLLDDKRIEMISFLRPYLYNDFEGDDYDLTFEMDMTVMPEYIKMRNSPTLTQQYRLFIEASQRVEAVHKYLETNWRKLLYYLWHGFDNDNAEEHQASRQDYLEKYLGMLQAIRKNVPPVIENLEKEYVILREMILAFEYGADNQISSIVADYLR